MSEQDFTRTKELLKLTLSFFWDKSFLFGAIYGLTFFVILYLAGLFL